MVCLQYIWKQFIHTMKQLHINLCHFPLPSVIYLIKYFPFLKALSFTCKYFIRAASAEVLLQFLLLVAFK